MNKTILVLSSLLALSAMAHADNEPSLLPKPTGQALTINGKVYYKTTVTPPAGVSARSAAAPAAPTLRRGEVLQPARRMEPATVSGTILVQLAAPQDAAALARDYGLTVRHRSQSVVLFDTPPQAELLSLQQRLQGDKRVRQAQLELVSEIDRVE